MTTKELTALEEQLGAEQVAIKKCRTLAAQCSDPALKQRFEQIAQKHQQHYNSLSNYLVK